jgi:uncharacterized membrane protein
MEETNKKTASANDKHIIDWQKRMMPWLIIAPSALILIFILLATVQLRSFESHIYQSDSLNISKSLPKVDSITIDTSITTKLGYLKLYALTKMEEYSINRRYNQAGEILVSGIYTKYMGFFTGMILAIVGAIFIISKLKEDTSNLEGTINEHINFKLVSSSPGIVFGVLGTLLMITTIFKTVESNVTDAPLFLNYQNVEQPKGNDENAAMNDLENQNSQQHIDSSRAENATP